MSEKYDGIRGCWNPTLNKLYPFPLFLDIEWLRQYTLVLEFHLKFQMNLHLIFQAFF